MILFDRRRKSELKSAIGSECMLSMKFSHVCRNARMYLLSCLRGPNFAGTFFIAIRNFVRSKKRRHRSEGFAWTRLSISRWRAKMRSSTAR